MTEREIGRENLIELLNKLETKCISTALMISKPLDREEWFGIFADYLLEHYLIVPRENNFIALPANIGDTVYQIGTAFTKCTPYDYKPKYYEDSECIGCEAKCDSEPYDVIHKGTIVNFKYDGKLFVQVKWENKFDTSYYEIGKDVFLSEDEVEKILVEKISKE